MSAKRSDRTGREPRYSTCGPTSISLAELRANALHRLLCSPRGQVERVEQIPSLCFTWPSEQIQAAIADLVHDGRIAESANGRLIVRRRGAA